MLPDADPVALLNAFLTAHAAGHHAPVQLYAKGEELLERLRADPPRDPAWGRFLVALGQIAANHLDDAQAASRHFLLALTSVNHHGDHQAAVAAGYNQGVLQEARGSRMHARTAYAAAAKEGFRLGAVGAPTLAAATRAVRLWFEEHEMLNDEHATLAKQAWLGWLRLRIVNPAELSPELTDELGRQLCALLLPEDHPAALAGAWRAWPPHALAEGWSDDLTACRRELFLAAAEAADRHLADEGPAPGAPYRLLASKV